MANAGPTKLATAIERRGTNQAEVARALKVSRPYVNQILSGQRKPSLDVAARIEREYGIPASDFAEVA